VSVPQPEQGAVNGTGPLQVNRKSLFFYPSMNRG
jgi:hypothetical protein